MKQLGFNLNDLHKMTIGFDHIMNGLDFGIGTNSNSFPPHNIIKISDTEFAVELAVAGFTRDQLSIEYEDDMLVISGDSRKDNDSAVYLYKGISSRHFIKKLKLVNGHKISGANLKDGILSIFITRQVLEPNRITIDIA